MRMALIGALLVWAAACGGSTSGAAATTGEVAESQTKLDLPPVPEFQAPQPNPDGTHSPLEMRRFGSKYLDQTVKLKGFVVYKYDCVATLGAKVYKDTP